MIRNFAGKRSFERLLFSFFKSDKGFMVTKTCRLRANVLARRRARGVPSIRFSHVWRS